MTFHVGEQVKVVKGESAGSKALAGKYHHIQKIEVEQPSGRGYVTLDDENKTKVWFNEIKGVTNMFTQMGADFKTFIAEHKATIYWIALLFLADHFLFNGAFRVRLQEIMNKLLGKVEAHVEGKTVTLVQPTTTSGS